MGLIIERYEGRRGHRNRRDNENTAPQAAKSNLQIMVERLMQSYSSTVLNIRVPVEFLKAIYDLQELLAKNPSKMQLNLELVAIEKDLMKSTQHFSEILEDLEAIIVERLDYKKSALIAFNENEHVKLDEIMQENFSWWHSIVNDFEVVGNEAMVTGFIKHMEEQGLLERTRALENALFEDVVNKFCAKGYECNNIEELRAKCGIGDCITASYKSMLDIQIKEALNTVLHMPGSYRKGFKQRCSEIYLAIAQALAKKVEQDYAYFVKTGFMQASLIGFKKEAEDCRILLQEVRRAMV